MSNYKIHIDKPLPTPPQMESHQDFDQLYGKYRSMKRFEFWRNLYRKPTYFAALVALLGIGYLVVDSANSPTEPAAFIQPPFMELDPGTEHVNIGVSSADSLQLPNGMTLFLPESPFEDSNQQAVVGPIELRYRELESPFAPFLAGIPLNYDSAGQQSLAIQSMVEIRAFQDNKLLQLREGKELQISYVGGEKAPRSHYFLDAESHNWLWQGMEVVSEMEQESAIPPKPQRPTLLAVRDVMEDTVLTPKAFETPPPKPGTPFKVSIANITDFPEMQGYENVYWEKLDDSHAHDPNRETVKWGSATLKKGRGDTYLMTFTRSVSGKTVRRKVMARPMFRADSKSAAQRIYQQKLQTYRNDVAAYEARKQSAIANQEQAEIDAAAREAAEAAYREELRIWEAKYGEVAVGAEPEGYLRRIPIKYLGIHALGSVLSESEETTVKVSLPPDSGKEIDMEGSTLYASLRESAALISISADESGRFLLPTKPGLIQACWLLTREGKLARINLNDLSSIDPELVLNGVWIPVPQSSEAFTNGWEAP